MIIYYFILFIILILLLSFILIKINKIANGGNKKINDGLKKTYKIILFNNGKQYSKDCYKYIINKLNSLGWVEKPHETKYVDFAFSLYNNNYIKADLKSSLNGIKTIGNKKKIVELMKTSKHVPYGEDLKTYKWCGDVVIVKEVNSSQQLGVYVIIDKANFIKLKEKLAHKDTIVSKYIQNPLLFQGKKFHLRVMIYIYVKKNGHTLTRKIFYIKDLDIMLMAKKKYIIKTKKDYLDRDMNITGGSNNDKLYKWPQDFQSAESPNNTFLQKCKKSIHDAVYDIPLNILSLYDEQNAGIFLFGVDVLLDDTGHAWILEINTEPRLIGKEIDKFKNQELKKKYINNYFLTLFKFILDYIVLPYFSFK
jgi:hypothetical protein